MKKFLILGAQGQLGIELQKAFQNAGHVIALGRDACDLSDSSAIRAAIRQSRPDVILNAVAYTAVDRAESEPELAMSINGHAPGVLAEEAKKNNSLLIHYSSDYVFDGSKGEPWVEDDPVNPLNQYGLTKLAGERNVQQAGGRFLIFRTSWVFSPHGRNFLCTMLRLGQERKELSVVNDQKGAPTSALALAAATGRILGNFPPHNLDQFTGIYHMTCAGETSWFGFTEAIFSQAQASRPWAPVVAIPSSQYPTASARPTNSVLSNQKLKAAFDVELPSWESALDTVLRAMNLHKS